MSIPVGIDLGTTYSAASWYNELDDRVESIPVTDEDGNILRSVVYYPGNGDSPVVGESAWNAQLSHSDRVVVGVKRSMGTGFTKEIDGEKLTAPMISAEVLKQIAKRAEIDLGESISDVVITVPAHFEDGERAATEEAGELAGLNVIELLSEPQAAALAYAVEEIGEITENYILVYDLGGGTFDVTLVKASSAGDASEGLNLDLDTLVLKGERQLGGLDWDKALAEFVIEKVEEEHGVDLSEDPKKLVFLKQNCEAAKRRLTRESTAQIVADGAGNTVEVSRAEFDECTASKLAISRERLIDVLKEAEEKHGLTKDKIEILMVGGSCRMPQVKEMLTEVMGKEPKTHRNPELHVTRGAAYWAHIIQNRGDSTKEPGVVVATTRNEEGKRQKTGIKVGGIVEITTHAVGVEALKSVGGEMVLINSVIIPEGTKYEEYSTKVFGLSEDNMDAVPINIYRGEDEDLAKCRKMGEVRIEDLPPGLPAGTEVEVRIGFDSSGIVSGTAKVMPEDGDEREVTFRVERGGVEIVGG